MASYLILDGYNIIGALERYQKRDAGDLDAIRELLVNDALKAAGWTGRTVVVVFDAHRSPGPRSEEPRTRGAVRVLYSAAGESADDVIERLVDDLDGTVTVCTADFALQRAALAHGATRATPQEFQELLDEMPALARTPRRPRRSSLSDRLSPDVLRSLESIRRRMQDR